MNTYLDCMVCFVKQTLDTMRMFTDDEALQQRVLHQVMRETAQCDMSLAPPVMSQRVSKIIRDALGTADPYVEAKQRFNRFALGMKDELSMQIAQSQRPWEMATRLAIAGNIIDFGVHSDIDEDQVQTCINDSMTADLDRDKVDRFELAVKNAKKILYLADNAGEIVFDQLLLELMEMGRVTVAVKGGPIINDATMNDAIETGLTDMVQVIDNGVDAPGTVLAKCHSEFLEVFNKADLIISKGQGNFETLCPSDRPIWFLLKVKCHIVAKHLKLPMGTLALIEPNSQRQLYD